MADNTYERASFNFDDIDDMDDGYRGFDVREEANGRGPLILALAGGVLVVFGAVVWNTYSNGSRADGQSVPTLLAETTEYRTEGPDVDRLVDPQVTSRVYGQIETGPEELAGGVKSASVQTVRDPRLDGDGPRDLRPASTVEDAPAVPADPIEAIRGPLAVEAAPKELASLETSGLPGGIERIEPAPEVGTIREVQVAEPAEAARPAMPQPRFAFAEDGVYMVQLAALRSEDAANTAWGKMASVQPDVFRGATRYVQRADLGAKGVFYRLRAGSFADRDEAVSFCDAIKAKGNNCIVVEK